MEPAAIGVQAGHRSLGDTRFHATLNFIAH
jgi:hypothetical protein